MNQMFPDTDTWNPLAGACRFLGFRCQYCYTGKGRIPRILNNISYGSDEEFKFSGPLRIYPPAFDGSFSKTKTTMVCSCTDICAPGVTDDMQEIILTHVAKHSDKAFLILSKDIDKLKNQIIYKPKQWEGRFEAFLKYRFRHVTFATTVETNRNRITSEISAAPDPYERIVGLNDLPFYVLKALSIEPVCDFDVKIMLEWIDTLELEYVTIGANTNNKVELEEPERGKLFRLIKDTSDITEVRVKHNLDRFFTPRNWHTVKNIAEKSKQKK